MALDSFLIAPLGEGIRNDLRPWLIPDQAFEKLNNAYVFRGRVKKRPGSTYINLSVDPEIAHLNSRLRVKVGTTDVAGNIAGAVPGVQYFVGQVFSIDDDIFTVVDATPGPQTMLSTDPATTQTYDVATGNYAINNSTALTDVYFYPSLPVMGLITYDLTEINNEDLIGFDTQFAYRYDGTSWDRFGTAIWSGTNSKFFWGENYRGVNSNDKYLFVTNFSSVDNIKYWDGAAWNNFKPVYNSAGDTIDSARLIISFKDRLLLLNIIESTGNFPNRLRFSQNGNPLQVDAWREDIPGKGDFLDAPVQEAIISAQTLKDRLIVFFERSTFELVYTGNEILPFRWQKINTELGAESTFSIVPFDKVTIGMGNVGIHACNGVNLERIDDKIPDEVFKIHNTNNGLERVYAIRDYTTELIYWAIPSIGSSQVFPDRVLIYNYRNNTWGFNDDSITCFGYYQNSSTYTWGSIPGTWESLSTTWNNGSQGIRFRQVVAGNQQGFVFIVDSTVNRNSGNLYITNIDKTSGTCVITSINHNLKVNDYILFENGFGSAADAVDGLIFPVTSVIDGSNFTIVAPGMAVSDGYGGGTTAAKVSRIDILTKRFNFYTEEGEKFFLNRAEFLVDKTANGEITVDYFASSSRLSLLTEAQSTGSITGSGSLETSPYSLVPLENTQNRFWHGIYPQAEGESIQFRFYLNDSQMLDNSIAFSDFTLNAMLFTGAPSGDFG